MYPQNMTAQLLFYPFAYYKDSAAKGGPFPTDRFSKTAETCSRYSGKIPVPLLFQRADLRRIFRDDSRADSPEWTSFQFFRQISGSFEERNCFHGRYVRHRRNGLL